MTFPRHLRLQDSSHVGEARRLVASLCHLLDFDESRIGQAELITTELATNLVKHTAGLGGDLVFSPMYQGGASGLDILSLDQGPGIANIGECLRDGHSTSASLGTGLGAIRRLSASFDVFSRPGQGVAVLSRLWKSAPPEIPPAMLVGAVCLPVGGEQACGDAWAVNAGASSTLFLLADGLGHGPDAAAASNLAVAIFQQQAPQSPAELLRLIHAGLRGTRGAAVAVAEVMGGTRQVRFAGLGNICGLILSEQPPRHLLSHNGTAGCAARSIQEFSVAWPEDGLLVMHSDGLASHWSLDTYAGLAAREPALIAGVLFRDQRRLRDDNMVVVARPARPRLAP